MKTYEFRRTEWRVEGPAARDGWVCATNWHQTRTDALIHFREHYPGQPLDQCKLIRRETVTVIEELKIAPPPEERTP